MSNEEYEMLLFLIIIPLRSFSPYSSHNDCLVPMHFIFFCKRDTDENLCTLKSEVGLYKDTKGGIEMILSLYTWDTCSNTYQRD